MLGPLIEQYTCAEHPLSSSPLAPWGSPPAQPPVAGATPPPPPPPPVPSPGTINLYENVLRLKLNVDRIAALHGPRLAMLNDLAIAAGRGDAN